MQRKGTPATKKLFILKDYAGNYAVDEWAALFTGSEMVGSEVVAREVAIGEERATGRALCVTDWGGYEVMNLSTYYVLGLLISVGVFG